VGCIVLARGGGAGAVKIAVLGPGGVGGLLAGALQRGGNETIVVARESTAELIAERGLRVQSASRWTR
jgi:2-dehydropantoate 2-reductase